MWTRVGKYGIIGKKGKGKIWMGRRIIGIILVCACLIGLIGCASEPKNRPYDKEPKTGGITLADFGLYKDGKLDKHIDLEGEPGLARVYIEYTSYFDTENLVYETWRGIKLQDSLEQMLEAYESWGMPDDVSFSGISEPIENLNQMKELAADPNWNGELGSCYIGYTWYCKPGTCEFTREPLSEEDVRYSVEFRFDDQYGKMILECIDMWRFGAHPEEKEEGVLQEQQTTKPPSKYQGEILENISEQEFGIYRGSEPVYTDTATEKYPIVESRIYGMNSSYQDCTTLRGIGFLSKMEELCEAYGDFTISSINFYSRPISEEQWKGKTLEEFAKTNRDILKIDGYIDLGVQKQRNTWSVCTRDRSKDEKPVEDVTEYWLKIEIRGDTVSSIDIQSYYLGERDLDALYAQIQEERGLTVSN